MSKAMKYLIGNLVMAMVGAAIGGGLVFLYYPSMGASVFAVIMLVVAPLGFIGGSIVSLWANWEG